MASSAASSARASTRGDESPRASGDWRRRGALILLVLVVAIPRFDMWDPGPLGRLTAGAKSFAWGHPVDVEGYARLVSWFRGEAPADSMIAPFCYRTLAPAAAAALPLPPTRALNVVNLLALVGTVLLLDGIGAALGFGARRQWAMGLLFAISFPTFYYGAIGFIDPVAVAGGAAILWATLRRVSIPALVAVCALATVAKETNAAFALTPLAGAWIRGDGGAAVGGGGGRGNARDIARATAPFLICVAAFLLARNLLPFPERGYFWTPSASAAVDNLMRPRTYVSLLLTLGPAAGFAVAALATGRVARAFDARGRAVLLGGASLAFGLYLYSILSAYTDGRIVWAVYPFLLPLAAAWFAATPRGGGRVVVGRRE